MMDELLTAQGCGDVYLNHPVNGDWVQKSFLNLWLNPYMKDKAIPAASAGVMYERNMSDTKENQW